VPLWVIGVACVVVLAMIGALAYMVLAPGSSPRRNGPLAAPHTSYPVQWDKRVLPEVRIAEKDRGLDFVHPVPVRFLSPAAFRKTVTKEDKVTAGDRREIQRQAGLLRAFGLVSGKVDLLHAVQDFSGAAVLAYYSFRTKSVTVRGHVITPSVKATLVHELTHVLQDQHYHVGAKLHALDKHSTSANNDVASVLHAITEGDAERVEHSYGSSLGQKQRHALVRAQQREGAQAQPGLASVPKIIIAFESSPYELGEGLVRAVAEHGGNGAVARLFRHPPAHDIALLDPFRVIEGHDGALRVPVPALSPGEKRFDSGDFGALSWYLMLSARLPAREALRTVDGWGGDSYVGYQAGGQSCARINYRGRTSSDTNAMYGALVQWAGAAPSATATVNQNGGVVTFQSCDPGTGAQTVNDDFQAAIDLVGTRTLMGVSLMHSGAPPAVSRCIAGRLAQTYSVAQLNDPTFGRNDPTVQARVQQIALGCR
jgi:hypothetical protein